MSAQSDRMVQELTREIPVESVIFEERVDVGGVIDHLPPTYGVVEVEAIIRRTWEVALRAGMQWVREKTMRGYDLDRFVEEVLEHRSEER